MRPLLISIGHRLQFEILGKFNLVVYSSDCPCYACFCFTEDGQRNDAIYEAA